MSDDDLEIVTEMDLAEARDLNERLTPIVRDMAKLVEGLPGGEVGGVLGKLVSGYIAGYDEEYRPEMWVRFKELVEQLFDCHNIMPSKQ